MNIRACILVIGLLCAPLISFSASLANTSWINKDDKTGKTGAIIRLDERNGLVNGTIIEVFPESGDTGICSKCPATFHNKPIKGLQIVWGLHEEGKNVWGKGHILDPRTGTIHRAKMVLHGDKLYVRGYVGVSLLGKTQVWERKNTTMDS